jgi:ribosomal protein L40E
MRPRFVDVPTRKLNRLKSRAPRGGLYWCWRCDRNAVGESERCRVCGTRGIRPKMYLKEVP